MPANVISIVEFLFGLAPVTPSNTTASVAIGTDKVSQLATVDQLLSPPAPVQNTVFIRFHLVLFPELKEYVVSMFEAFKLVESFTST